MGEQSKMTVEKVNIEDAEELLRIYAPYVKETAISFEYEVPSVEEFADRIRHISSRYPYIKAVEDGKILGYAYAGPFKARAAYDWSVETTIYLARNAQKRGIGRMLYQALENELRRMGIHNLYACIAYPQTEDEYLTKNSAQFHAHLGYSTVGTFHSCGYKFDRWYDMVWMEKLIGEHQSGQSPIRPYPALT